MCLRSLAETDYSLFLLLLPEERGLAREEVRVHFPGTQPRVGLFLAPKVSKPEDPARLEIELGNIPSPAKPRL